MGVRERLGDVCATLRLFRRAEIRARPCADPGPATPGPATPGPATPGPADPRVAGSGRRGQGELRNAARRVEDARR